LSDLEYYSRDYVSGRIVTNENLDVKLFDALKGVMQEGKFIGGNVDILLRTTQPYTAQAHTEDADIPYPGTVAFVKMQVPLKEVIVNAGLTLQARDRATGGLASWGRIVEEVLDDQQIDLKNLLRCACMSNGTGIIAVAHGSATGAGSVGDPYVIALENTYTTLGIENAALCQVGMKIDVYAANLTTKLISGGEITARTFGNRANGAATNGSISVVGTLLTGALADSDVIVPTNSLNLLPMGLVGLIQDGTHYTASQGRLTTFQTQTRTSYSALKALVWQATDFGLASESPSDGTPTVWSIGSIDDIFTTIETGTGRKQPNLLMCGKNLAKTIDRRSKEENNITVTVSTVQARVQPAAGSRYATEYIAPDGRRVPIKIDNAIPDNVLYGLCLDDLNFYPFGKWDFLREYGDIWEPARGGRKTNYEAPFHGYYNIGADRVDNCFVMQDMRTDL